MDFLTFIDVEDIGYSIGTNTGCIGSTGAHIQSLATEVSANLLHALALVIEAVYDARVDKK